MKKIILAVALLFGVSSVGLASETQGLHVLYFTSPACGVCKAHVDPELEKLKRSGWKIGPGPGQHIQIVNGDVEVDLANKYGITSYPTFVQLQDGVAVVKYVGAEGIDSYSIAKMRKGVDERPAPPWINWNMQPPQAKQQVHGPQMHYQQPQMYYPQQMMYQPQQWSSCPGGNCPRSGGMMYYQGGGCPNGNCRR